jgi:hypothetical protein
MANIIAIIEDEDIVTVLRNHRTVAGAVNESFHEPNLALQSGGACFGEQL